MHSSFTYKIVPFVVKLLYIAFIFLAASYTFG